MAIITIEVKDESMIVHNEKLSHARIVWVAPGLTVYVKGALPGLLYEQACNLALNVCLGMHIPVMSLKRYNAKQQQPRYNDTKSRRMF